MHVAITTITHLCFRLHHIRDYQADVELALPNGLEVRRGTHLRPQEVVVQVALHPQMAGILNKSVAEKKHEERFVDGVGDYDLFCE